MPLWSQTSCIPKENHFIPGSVTTISQNSEVFEQIEILKSKKALQRYLGFVNYDRNFIPRMVEKVNRFYKLLKSEIPINLTSKLKETFHSVNKALNGASQLALKQPTPGKQLVFRTDASFRNAGYALMIGENPDQKIQSKRKTFAFVAFGSEIFCPAQRKMSIYSNEDLAIYMAFFEFAHIL